MPTAAGLYYFAHEANDHSRLPVILIHGAGGNHLSWPPQLRRLPDQRIFAPDLPAHGKSEGIGRHTIEDYVQDVLEFMSELKIYSAILVGHSMGSAVALSAAIHFPKRVTALGLIGSGARLTRRACAFTCLIRPVHLCKRSANDQQRSVLIAIESNKRIINATDDGDALHGSLRRPDGV